jgi:hypothetical protein
MEEMRNAYKFLVRKLKGRDHLEDLCIDGRIISGSEGNRMASLLDSSGPG